MVALVRGVLKTNVALAPFTSWRIGGNARTYFRPADLADLQAYLQRTQPQPEDLFWLGLGSNVLIRDGGIDAQVVHTLKALDEIEILADSQQELLVRVQAGYTCAKFAKFAVRHGAHRAEFFAGIPGTMGGALAMNAGAFGGETWNLVVGLQTIDAHGELHTRAVEEFTYGYRSVQANDPKLREWFVAGIFKLPKSQEDSKQRIKQLLAERSRKQPIGEWSCGSVFKNPSPQHAAQLIEASKLKGRRIGDAQVSPKHANFIINLGTASATAVEELMQVVQQTVAAEHGIMLVPEVKIIGEPVV